MGSIRAIGVVIACVLAPACALDHTRPVAASAPRGSCMRGAITHCAPCEVLGCCLHFCQEDRTWSTCGYVESSCTDAGPVGSADDDRDR